MKIYAGRRIKSLAAIIPAVTAIRSANDTVGTSGALLHETTAIIITLLYI